MISDFVSTWQPDEQYPQEGQITFEIPEGKPIEEQPTEKYPEEMPIEEAPDKPEDVRETIEVIIEEKPEDVLY